MSCYDEETSKRLINTLLAKAPIKYKCFVILAILTGFRRGEIVGLHWDDIDFKNHKITVNRSAYYLSGQPTSEKGPKTDTSNRTIVVPKLCFDLLKQWRAEQGKMRLAIGDKWQGAENIFTTDNGRIMNPSTGPKWFSDFLEKNNFPHIRFHDLRHTFATLLISGNVDVKTVSHKLGHASPTTTMNFYVHSLESTDRASAELLENMLIKENNL
jgi:integrase